ncbi:precorrin-6y C5,15-methyltransferase (decarboxylating) subunit CbiE [Clostridium ganghwense]|uniref:Precorrin-6y C5,15-methyltransferase (Decarboxylating) subunit CbiE n=1 Tax=Clostridium ganghwense TaxID=312089 RepID=A0ABT4CSZ8_9CLOT|nr:precorrin-6y C5,15-methyltransferase (decarboxylating) subunit CbiE [Clostridium ganghwense]MCY6372172.1 precorrin-6y C5,15-methyltransferase (decarboxylating) subunit CbiE [Clostridium ganghwense]
MVNIVGLGPGSREYILPKALETLKKSDVVLGFKRALQSIEFLNVDKKVVTSLKEILEFINTEDNKEISIIASGDPCFYGIAEYVGKNYRGKVQVIPGISSFQYMTARLNKAWQGCFLGSLHGREEDFLNKVKEHKLSIWLTDKNNSPDMLCKKLFNEKINAKVYVGENLSYSDEKITIGYPEELKDMDFSNLTVVIIEKLGE